MTIFELADALPGSEWRVRLDPARFRGASHEKHYLADILSTDRAGAGGRDIVARVTFDGEGVRGVWPNPETPWGLVKQLHDRVGGTVWMAGGEDPWGLPF